MTAQITPPKKLIEVALPLDAINVAAARKKSIRQQGRVFKYGVNNEKAAQERARPEIRSSYATSLQRVLYGKLPPTLPIEVKGRAKGRRAVAVKRNEILNGLNQVDKLIMATVLVDGDQHEGPYYLTKPFTQEPYCAVASINLVHLLVRSIPQGATL